MIIKITTKIKTIITYYDDKTFEIDDKKRRITLLPSKEVITIRSNWWGFVMNNKGAILRTIERKESNG